MENESSFYLRPYKKCDAKIIVGWIKDITTFCRWSQGKYNNYPVTDKDMINYYEDFSYDEVTFPMTACENNNVIGHIMLKFTDNQTVRLGCVIVDDNQRGKGYGSRMLKSTLEYAFNILNVSRVTIGVFEDNEPAIACYKKLGFEYSGEYNMLKLEGNTYKCLEFICYRS